jgi:hypothetical protein
VAGWAYALEEFHCRTGTYVAVLSERGRAFCVHRHAFLRFLEGELGIHLPFEEAETELPAAAFA